MPRACQNERRIPVLLLDKWKENKWRTHNAAETNKLDKFLNILICLCACVRACMAFYLFQNTMLYQMVAVTDSKCPIQLAKMHK